MCSIFNGISFPRHLIAMILPFATSRVGQPISPHTHTQCLFKSYVGTLYALGYVFDSSHSFPTGFIFPSWIFTQSKARNQLGFDQDHKCSSSSQTSKAFIYIFVGGCLWLGLASTVSTRPASIAV